MNRVGTATFVSYRLGGTDGVSVEAGKWMHALESLGFTPRRVAGEIADPHTTGEVPDLVVPWLALDAPLRRDAGCRSRCPCARRGGPHRRRERLLAPAEPARPPGRWRMPSRTPGPAVVLHHHDLPWQRPQTADVTDLPPTPPGALHVTINGRSRRELRPAASRRSRSRTPSTSTPRPVTASKTRDALGFAPDEIVVLQPARAIPRKNVPAALGLRRSARPPGRAAPRRVLAHRTGRGRLPGRARSAARGRDGAHPPGARPDPGRRVRGGGRRRLPVDRRGVRQPGDRVRDRATTTRRRPLPRSRRDPGPRLRALRGDGPGRRRRLPRRRRTTRSSTATSPAPGPHYSLAGLPDRIDSAFRAHGWTTW